MRDMQRFLMLLRRYARARDHRGKRLTRLAVAYGIWHEYDAMQQQTPPARRHELPQCPVPPIDYNDQRLREVRANVQGPPSKSGGISDSDTTGLKQAAPGYLRLLLRRDPTDAEVAAEVAERYAPERREGAPANVEKKMGRLVKEAKTYEYVHLGNEHLTGRAPLPEPRRDKPRR